MILHFQRILLDTATADSIYRVGGSITNNVRLGQQSAMVHALETTEFRVKDTGAKRYHERRRPQLHKLRYRWPTNRDQSERERDRIYTCMYTE